LFRSDLKRPQLFAWGVAAVAVGLVSCGGNGSSTNPPVAPTFTPAPPLSPSALTSPCAGAYAAYEPDGGTGTAGIQTIRYATAEGTLCGTSSTAPTNIAFGSSVGAVGFSPNLTTAVALLRAPDGGYHYAQDVAGASLGQLVPVGAVYDFNTQPTAAPTTAPTAGATASPSPTPTLVPTIADGSSVSIVGDASSSVALVLGPAASAIVALTSLANAPPQYGSSIPFMGGGYTIAPQTAVRSNVLVSPDSAVALVRGPSDLLAFSISVVASGYQFNAAADDPTLGSGGVVLRGVGNIAFSPRSSARALVGGTTAAGTGNVLTLVTGLPGAITKGTALTLPGNINSIAIDTGGTHAYVATDAGIVVVSGVSNGVLVASAPFAPTAVAGENALPYTDCNGRATTMTNVASVRLSSYVDATGLIGTLVALGQQPGTTCASGANDAVVAIPIVPTTGLTPSPAPSTTALPAVTQFTQNNVVAPPSAADYFLVH